MWRIERHSDLHDAGRDLLQVLSSRLLSCSQYTGKSLSEGSEQLGKKGLEKLILNLGYSKR